VAQVAAKATHLRRLELEVTRRLDGFLSGEFAGVSAGPGTEAAGARPYAAGDDARRIDWNLTARSAGPHVRTTEPDRELETWVVADRSASLDFGTSRREKRELVLEAVAAFGFLTVGGGNRLGLVVAGGDRLTRMEAVSTRTALLASLSRLYDEPRHERRPPPGADLAAGLRAVERIHRRRGQVVAVSDFLDDGDWELPMRRLAMRHQVVAVQAVDRRELELPAVGILTLVDTESGRQLDVQTNSAALRARYAGAARARNDAIVRKIRAAGAEHLALFTDGDWLLQVVAFVGRRRGRRAGPGAGPRPSSSAATPGPLR
jgi:uncharacterized protein (DUF58 family)